MGGVHQLIIAACLLYCIGRSIGVVLMLALIDLATNGTNSMRHYGQTKHVPQIDPMGD